MGCGAPADEGIALDGRLHGLRRRVAELDKLRHVGLGVPVARDQLVLLVDHAILEVDRHALVFGDLDAHDLIGRHVCDLIGVLRSSMRRIGFAVLFRQRHSGSAYRGSRDGRLSRRIRAVHGHGKCERFAVLHNRGLIGADGVAAAALERDGVSRLFPDRVERHVACDLSGEGRAGGVCSFSHWDRRPALELIAAIRQGRRPRRQLHCLTVGLLDRRRNQRHRSPGIVCRKIAVEADFIGLRHVAPIEDRVFRDTQRIRKHLLVFRAAIPAVEGVAGLRRSVQRGKRRTIFHLLRCHLRAVEHVGHISEDDCRYVDGHGLVRGDIADRIFASRIAFLLPVDIDALDGVARARRDLESNVFAMLNSRALVARDGLVLEGHVDLVAHRQGDRVLDFLRQINVDMNFVFIRVILIIVFRILLLTLDPMLRGIGTNVVQSSPHKARVCGVLSILDDKQILRIITIVESDGKGLLAAPRYVGLFSCFADPDAIVFISALRAVRLIPRAIISRINDCHSVRFPDGIENDILVAERDFFAARIVCFSRCCIFSRRPAKERFPLCRRGRPRNFVLFALCAGQVVRPVRRAAVRRVVAHESHRVRIGCFRRLPHRRKDSVLAINNLVLHYFLGLEKCVLARQRSCAIISQLDPRIAAPALEGVARERRRPCRNRIGLRGIILTSRVERPYRDAIHAGVSAVFIGDRAVERKICDFDAARYDAVRRFASVLCSIVIINANALPGSRKPEWEIEFAICQISAC